MSITWWSRSAVVRCQTQNAPRVTRGQTAPWGGGVALPSFVWCRPSLKASGRNCLVSCRKQAVGPEEEKNKSEQEVEEGRKCGRRPRAPQRNREEQETTTERMSERKDQTRKRLPKHKEIKQAKKTSPSPPSSPPLDTHTHTSFTQPCFSSVNNPSVIVSHLLSQPIRSRAKLLPGGIRDGGLPDRANCLWKITALKTRPHARVAFAERRGGGDSLIGQDKVTHASFKWPFFFFAFKHFIIYYWFKWKMHAFCICKNVSLIHFLMWSTVAQLLL